MLWLCSDTPWKTFWITIKQFVNVNNGFLLITLTTTKKLSKILLLRSSNKAKWIILLNFKESLKHNFNWSTWSAWRFIKNNFVKGSMLKYPDRNSCKYRDLLLLSEITEIKHLQPQNYTAKKANLQNVWTERRDL